MKYLFLFGIILSFVLVTGCGSTTDNGTIVEEKISSEVVTNPASAEGTESTKLAVMTFAKTEHDFGTIMEGTKVFYSFKFENTGNADLLISHVKATCGCTVADYPKNPMAPGEKGKIKITFDSTSKKGPQIKSITIMTNAQPPSRVLTVKAMVK